MKKTLLILTGKHKGKTLTLPDKVVVIGRDPQADIRVNSTEVSRLHCEIHVRNDVVIIKDLGSRNGTFLNGEAIFSEVVMQPGDTLHVGMMVFELAGKKKPAAEPSVKQRKPPAARAATKAASDEDVIDWLAEEEEFADTDTTIVSFAESEKIGLNDDSSTLIPQTTGLEIRPVEPGSHAALAAEIIRQYWAGKQG